MGNESVLFDVLSAKRLNAYRDAGDDDALVLCKYLWNVRLAESFYPALQTLEIALRNHLHGTIARQLNDSQWLHSGTRWLAPREKKEVSKIEGELQRRNRVLESDAILSELPFSFWTRLMHRDYEQFLWRGIWRAGIFPHLPRVNRTRHFLDMRFNSLRRFRNRVFHHEAICRSRSELNLVCQQHTEILQSIGWIEPVAANAIRHIDGFTTICTPLYFDAFRAKVQRDVLGI